MLKSDLEPLWFELQARQLARRAIQCDRVSSVAPMQEQTWNFGQLFADATAPYFGKSKKIRLVFRPWERRTGFRCGGNALRFNRSPRCG